MMRKSFTEKTGLILLLAVAVMFLGTGPADATINGLTGTSFNFTAKVGHISTADGFAPLLWGFANGSGVAQYPGPTLILNEGVESTITLTNQLPEPVSIVFPG